MSREDKAIFARAVALFLAVEYGVAKGETTGQVDYNAAVEFSCFILTGETPHAG